jgi:hypothetical protein
MSKQLRMEYGYFAYNSMPSDRIYFGFAIFLFCPLICFPENANPISMLTEFFLCSPLA